MKRAGIHWISLRLLAFILLLGAAFSAQAATLLCSEFPGGIVDGSNPAHRAAMDSATTFGIDRDCTIRNFPQSSPLDLTLINFNFPQQASYLIIFDNVFYIGGMSCNDPTQSDFWIWWVNGSYNTISSNCQEFILPVDSINKRNPAGTTTAAIGVPFTYSLTFPEMVVLTSTGYVGTGEPDIEPLYNVIIRDDLTASGAALTYVSNNAYLLNPDSSTTPLGSLNVITQDNKVLEFSYTNNPALAVIPAGSKLVIELTVVLDNSPANDAGTQFRNTATWQFRKAIDLNEDGVIDPSEIFDPVPGHAGVTPLMTIAGPDLIVTKTGSETALNLGVNATFTINVQNTGGADAWNTTIVDRLPDVPGVTGMCPATEPAVSARIYAANGVTPVSGPLLLNTDFTLAYTGDTDEPACQLTLSMISTAAVIGPTERLIITYTAQLDGDTNPDPNVSDGIDLTNVAGATQWFSADPNGGYPYATITKTLTDGTPAFVDYQDNFTLTTALSGYYFQKTVQNLTSSENPATTAVSGDRLRYRLRIFNFDEEINNVTVSDTLNPALFDLSTFTMVSPPPAGASYTFNNVTGELQITGDPPPLNLVPPSELVVEFEINLAQGLANGTSVPNQASFSATGPPAITAYSDDPFVNGIAAPGEPADPTTVVIQAPGPLAKANTQASATIGERFTYTITVPATPVDAPLYDVRILDDLSASAADLRFVSAAVVSGGSWTLSNTSGSNTNLVIEDLATGIDIPANGQAVIAITVELLNTLGNNNGLTFNNSASYTYNRANGNATTQTAGGAASTANMTVVEPAVTTLTKTASNVTAGKQPADPAAAGDVIEFVVTIPNSGSSTAFDSSVVDTPPVNVTLVSGSATARINGVPVAGFVANPDPLPGGAYAWGRANGDGTLDIPAGGTLVLTYRVTVTSVNGQPLNNSVYADWTSLQDPLGRERTGNGCPTGIVAPNDYCVGPVSAAFPTADTTTIVKSVVSDSWDSGLSTGNDSILRVGDTVVYRLALTLREGLLQNVVVTDTLPAGLAFDSVVSINGDTSAPFSAAAPFTYAAFTAPAVSGSTVTWSLGDITNAIDNNAANDTLVIEYRARVLKDTLPHTATTTLINNVALSYTGSNPASALLAGSASLTVLQPIMTTPTKSATGFTSPASVDVVTDVMPFHLESCNTTGLAPAYSVKFTDKLATQLNETTITTPEVRVGGTLLTAGSDYTYTPPAARGGTMVFVLNVPVNPGQCVTVDYTIGFYNDFGPNQTWTNDITLDEYWSLQAPTTTGQLYGPLDPTSFTMTNSTTITSPIKTLLSPASNEATIGDEVVYRIAVPGTVSNAALFDVAVTDTLHPGLAYVSATANVAFTNNTTGNNVSLVIPQIPAGQQAIIELRTRVANNTAANAGLSFANSASYTYATTSGGAPISGGSDATDTLLRIVEPNIAVTKNVAPNTPPAAGAILTYTLTHTASGGANFSNAYDVSIVDRLSLGLAYVAGSATLNGAPLADPTLSGDGITTPQVLTWNTGLDIPEGTTPVVTYQVQVLAGVGANQVLSNNARVAWTSLNGVNANERTGSGTPAYNDYFADASIALTTPAPGALSKQNPATTTVTIGQPFTYTITVPQAMTALYDVKIIDNLPAGVVFVGVTKLSSWGTWTPVNSGTATNVMITDSNGQGIDIPAFDPALNPPDQRSIEIALTVVLADDVGMNNSGRTFSNTASYTYDQANDDGTTQQAGGSDTTDPLTIIGPDILTMDKSGPAEMTLNIPEVFTLNVHNAGTGTAWNVTVTDILPNPTPGGMCDAAPTSVAAQLYQPDGVTPFGGPLAASDFRAAFTGAPSCTLTVTMQTAAGAIPAGYWMRITYQALLDADNLNGAALTNIAGATQWFSAGPAASGRHTYSRTLSDGTVSDPADHEDAHTVQAVTANGIVYDSLTRQPIAGATVTMFQAGGAALPAGCFDDPAQQNQLTNAFGHYSFELNFSQAQCPAGGNYVIAVTAAPAGYDTSAPSRVIPPTTSAATAPYSVPACLADAIPSPSYCEAQASSSVPTGAAATTYYLHLTLSDTQVPHDGQIFNNHIPVDPSRRDAGVAITKTSSAINVTRGQLVPYTITVRNNNGGVLQDLAIVDTLPPGFKYVAGSSRFDGNRTEPVIAGNGGQLRWENVALLPYALSKKQYVIKLLLVVSSGVSEGEYVNRAQVISTLLGEAVSGVAAATVRVTPDPTFDCTDILGKVFDDANLNGAQDANEKGLAGVRVVSARGLIAKTDAHGRYHITCAAVPNEARGSNFILKLDDRSLPTGYRLTTKNPLVQRVTRGKAIKFNFGATLHRVVRLDIADGVFEPESTEMRPQWKPRIGMLLSELRKAPAVLRISYLADVEDPAVVKARTEAVKREIADRWEQGNYQLTVETEIYWRRGAPPDRRPVVNDGQ